MTQARRAAWKALVALEKGDAARLVLDRRRLTPADRDFALELARGTERLHLFLDFALRATVCERLPADPHLRCALRLGAYQILLLGGVPDYAAVHETVSLVRDRRSFLNGALRNLARAVLTRPADPTLPRVELPLDAARTLLLSRGSLPDPETDPGGFVAARYGLPRFLVQGWFESFGSDVMAAAAASCRTPAVVLRPTLHAGGGAPQLAAELRAEGVETVPAARPDLLRWSGGASPFAGRSFAAGAFVVQDATAYEAAFAVGAVPGEAVLDACAAPGTKATLLAEHVGTTGAVYAYDADRRRRRLITGNAQRLRLDGVLRVCEAIDDVPAGVDRVLVDAPCSNTGVLARRVEVRRKLTPETAAVMATTQAELLRDALERVRVGGTVVYATCSIERVENQGVVAELVGDGVTLLREHTTLPRGDRDGGYHAVLQRRR
ncbi:MAG: transcription antitermination factor NusB [Planctomycetota bacterium]